MSDTAPNQIPNHPEPTRSVTVSTNEWCFLLICLIQASSRQPRAKVMARIIQQIIETPDQPLKLGFAQQDYRSLTAALPIELYKVVYEQATRHAESDSQYISRMLEQALPPQIYDLITALIAELRMWSITSDKDAGQGDQMPDKQPEIKASDLVEPISNTDDLTKFLTDHTRFPVVERIDNSAAHNDDDGQA